MTARQEDISLKDCKVQEITTFHTDKYHTGWLHGVELLPDGRILLTSRLHKSLHQFSSNGDLHQRVTLPDYPLDVTAISEDKAVVSYWDGICIVDINTMKINKPNINKDGRYYVYGITSMEDNIIGVCKDKIVMMDKNGSVMNVIQTPPPYDDCALRYVTAVSNTRLCYSNFSHDSVVCIDLDGTEVFTYKHYDLKSPHGVTSDNEGVIYVAGWESNNVQQLSPDGRLIKIILSEVDGINCPLAINFDRKNNQLLLTYSGSKVRRYQITK